MLSPREESYLRHAKLHPDGKPYGSRATTRQLAKTGRIEVRKERRGNRVHIFVHVTDKGMEDLAKLET